MKTKIVTLIVFFSLFFISCEKKAEVMAASGYEEALEEAVTETELNSKALSQLPKDKKFKKTVKISLGVENAYKTTLLIEDEVIKSDGYILKSKLENQVLSEKSVSISSDSIKKYTKIKTIDSIFCKIPSQKVSQFLSKLDGKYNILNLRDISLEDVTQEYVLGENQNSGSQKFSNRIENELKKGGKLESKVDAIETLKNYEDEKNNNRYYQAILNNDVKYATVEIELIEPEKYLTQTLANPSKYEEIDSPFLFKLKDAFLGGYKLLKWIIVLLVNIWPVFILALIGLFVVSRKNKHK